MVTHFIRKSAKPHQLDSGDVADALPTGDGSGRYAMCTTLIPGSCMAMTQFTFSSRSRARVDAACGERPVCPPAETDAREAHAHRVLRVRETIVVKSPSGV